MLNSSDLLIKTNVRRLYDTNWVLVVSKQRYHFVTLWHVITKSFYCLTNSDVSLDVMLLPLQ